MNNKKTDLKSLFQGGIRKNIFFIIAHQTEDINHMELACRKAARKLTFEYLEETGDHGWRGKKRYPCRKGSLSAGTGNLA